MAISTPMGGEFHVLGSSPRSHSVASITVAYNGAHLLERHLLALQHQTQKIQEIIVVNNASRDHTLELLAAKFPEITVLNLPDNGGVGAGLAAGIEYVTQKTKCEWIWLFDQDSVPAPDALEILFRNLKQADIDELAILAPVCEDPKTKMACPGLIWQEGRILKIADKPEDPLTLVDMVITSGSLMSTQAITEVGLPRTDFFMDFVDFEHCLRFRRHGYRIAVVRDSHVEHVMGEPTTFNVFGHTAHWTDQAPWRLYYMMRNEIFTIWRYYPSWKNKAFFFRRLARLTFFLLLFGKNKLACLVMMYRGIVDGRASRLGIRFQGGST